MLQATDKQMFRPLQASSGDVPIYCRLANEILTLISFKRLAFGDRLPPQREIARMVNVNLTTVTRAFSTLHERGVVDSKLGLRLNLNAARSREELSHATTIIHGVLEGGFRNVNLGA